jgi:hypothetical protein
MHDQLTYARAALEVPVRDGQQPEVRERHRAPGPPRLPPCEVPLERLGEWPDARLVLLEGDERERHGEDAKHAV